MLSGYETKECTGCCCRPVLSSSCSVRVCVLCGVRSEGRTRVMRQAKGLPACNCTSGPMLRRTEIRNLGGIVIGVFTAARRILTLSVSARLQRPPLVPSTTREYRCRRAVNAPKRVYM